MLSLITFQNKNKNSIIMYIRDIRDIRCRILYRYLNNQRLC